MKRLLHVEILKLRSYPLFWIAILLYAAFIPMLFGIFLSADFSTEGQEMDLFDFLAPNAGSLWQYLMFVGSYGVYVLILFLLSFSNRDIVNGVWRQYIIEGVSRNELVAGRVVLVLVLSALATLLLVIVGAFIISQKGYSGIGSALWELRAFTAGYALYFLSFMMMALVVNVFINSTTLSFLGVFFWGLFVEGVVRWIDPTTISQLLPVYNLNRLIPNPFSALVGGEVYSVPELQSVLVSAVWLFIFGFIIITVTRRKDF